MEMVPYSHQWIDSFDIETVIKTLRSGWLTQGPKIKEFEKAICKYTGAKYAVVVSNGTSALHLAVLAAGINIKDEVITSPITFVASANCVLYCGGIPVFADIEEDCANISPDRIKEKVNRHTKALIPVHFSGLPCEMKTIYEIAKKNDLVIIEDAAHALGAEYARLKIGSCKYSDMAIFSFHPVKSITTGEGGAITTNNRNFYEKILLFRNHGITKEKSNFLNKPSGYWYHEMQLLGFNYRISDIQSALGLSQLKKIDMFIEKRKRIADIYNKTFRGNPYFTVQSLREGISSSYHLYPIELNDNYKMKKESIFLKMQNVGLGVQVHYIPVYLQPYYKRLGYKKGLCPLAEDFYEREISIPLYPQMSVKTVNNVIKRIFSVFKNI